MLFFLLAVYQIIIQVQLFISTPISTNIEAAYPTEVPFPVIAICNNNQYRLSYLTGRRVLERPRRNRYGPADASSNDTDVFQEVVRGVVVGYTVRCSRPSAPPGILKR